MAGECQKDQVVVAVQALAVTVLNPCSERDKYQAYNELDPDQRLELESVSSSAALSTRLTESPDSLRTGSNGGTVTSCLINNEKASILLKNYMGSIKEKKAHEAKGIMV